MNKRIILTVILIVSIVSAQNSIVKQFSSAMADVAEKANPAVVTISAEKVIKVGNQFEQFDGFPFFHPQMPDQEYSSNALGSGVIVDAKNGYILTNNHVIENAEKIQITLMDNRIVSAEVIGTDPKSDVAVLKIDANNLTELPFGDSDKVRVGEWVLAVGSPFSENLSHTVTAGIVSAKGRNYIMPGNDVYEDFIQTDAAINPGNSGGALINLDGELIGINTAIATGGVERSNKGVGFAIPSLMVKRVMDDLLNKGYVVRSWIGVQIQRVDDKVARAMGLSDRSGALISEVVEDSPAHKADLEIGDVITGFDGIKISDTAHLKNVVSSTKPGKRSKIKLYRDGKVKTINITLEERDRDDELFVSNTEAKTDFGLEVKNISDSILQKYNLDSEVSGVIVTSVDRKSNAYEAGIRVGDVITRVGTKKISNRKQFLSLVDDARDQESILLLIKRGERSFYVAFEIE